MLKCTAAWVLVVTLPVVLISARLTMPELTVPALSHELFHASHRSGLKDLWLPEETQALLHTLRTTARLRISIPAVEQYVGLLYIAPIALCVFLIRPGSALDHETLDRRPQGVILSGAA